MTNADRIRTMSDEELAEFLDEVERGMYRFTSAVIPTEKALKWLGKKVGEE